MKLMKTKGYQKQKDSSTLSRSTPSYRVTGSMYRDRDKARTIAAEHQPDLGHGEHEFESSVKKKPEGETRLPKEAPVTKKNESGDNLVRLNKYLAECGIASRRSADELITEGRVSVNGMVVNTAGSKIKPDHDRVLVNRRPIKPQPKGMLLLHKPKGVVTTMSDPEGRRCVADYLSKGYRGYYPAGRLDWDSSGLVILTNDGEVADFLMHPRFGTQRTYHVRVEGIVLESVCHRLIKGIILEDGPVRVDSVSIIDGEGRRSKTQTSKSGSLRVKTSEEDDAQGAPSTWLEISIFEGRNRIVRRIFESVGHSVIKLKRVSHGPCKLGSLPAGQVRALSEREFLEMRRKILSGITIKKVTIP